MSARAVVRNAIWNYASVFAEGALGVVVVGFTVRAIGAVEYGILVLALAFAELLMLFDLGLFGVLPQSLIAARAREGDHVAVSLLRTALAAVFVLGSAALVVASIAAAVIGKTHPFGIDPSDVPAAMGVTLLAGALVQLALPATVLQKSVEAEEKFMLLGRLRVVLALLRAGATLVLLRAGFGVIALMLIQVSEAALRVAVMTAAARTSLGIGRSGIALDFSALRRVWSPGRWVFFENLANYGSYGLDSLIIGWRGSVGSAGVFGLGRKIPNQLWQLVQRAIAVALPSLVRDHAASASHRVSATYVACCRVFFPPMLAVTIASAYFAGPLVTLWLGNRYDGVAAVLRWLMLAVLFQTLAVPSINVLYATGRIESSARISIAESVANVALTLALVGPFGAPGAAAATAIVHGAATCMWLFPAAASAVGESPASILRAVAKDSLAPALITAGGCGLLILGAGAFEVGLRLGLGALVLLGAIVLWGATTAAGLWRAHSDREGTFVL